MRRTPKWSTRVRAWEATLVSIALFSTHARKVPPIFALFVLNIDYIECWQEIANIGDTYPGSIKLWSWFIFHSGWRQSNWNCDQSAEGAAVPCPHCPLGLVHCAWHARQSQTWWPSSYCWGKNSDLRHFSTSDLSSSYPFLDLIQHLSKKTWKWFLTIFMTQSFITFACIIGEKWWQCDLKFIFET